MIVIGQRTVLLTAGLTALLRALTVMSDLLTCCCLSALALAVSVVPPRAGVIWCLVRQAMRARGWCQVILAAVAGRRRADAGGSGAAGGGGRLGCQLTCPGSNMPWRGWVGEGDGD